MGVNRVFLPQDALDAWLTEGKIALEGEVMTLRPEGRRFRLKSAVRFQAELTGAGDEAELVGKVKDLEQLAALEGEHCADSVIIGDAAYEVIEGFVGEPISEETAVAIGGSLAAATQAAVGENGGADAGDEGDLARFFLQR